MSAIPEPPAGSVVLAHGETGTAYQRFFSDGLWYAAGAPRDLGGLTWEKLTRLSFHPLLIIYVAPSDPD